MAGVFIKDDLRRIKTQKSLLNALEFILQRRCFKNITVNDICGQAYISRSAFYANYKDKYDLLYAFFEHIALDYPISVENILDIVLYKNFKVIKNIFKEADSETMESINNFATEYINEFLKEVGVKTNPLKLAIFSNFCIGGVMRYIMIHVKNKSTPDISTTRQYFLSLIDCLLKWNNE